MSASIPREILSICQRLHGRNMLAAADGNVSYRHSDDNITITPTGRAKAFIDESELATITLSGEIVKGTPSGEYLMHLEVYKQCPTAKAAVHAHPPTAIAWTIAHPDLNELPSNCLPEVILALGKIPIAPYARPGTQGMGQVLRPLLPHHKAIILARHGALGWGENLQEAYWAMERIEHCAQILKQAQELGGLTELPEQEIAALMAMREKIGNKTL